MVAKNLPSPRQETEAACTAVPPSSAGSCLEGTTRSGREDSCFSARTSNSCARESGKLDGLLECLVCEHFIFVSHVRVMSLWLLGCRSMT